MNAPPWLLFVPSKVLIFFSALSSEGRKCMEQNQKHSKTCTEAGMKSVQECWHGKESDYPSMKVKKVEQERVREGVRKWWDTHMCTHTHTHESQASSFLSSPSQRQVCFHGADTSHQRAITARLHSDALQRYRCGGGSREMALADKRYGRPNNPGASRWLMAQFTLRPRLEVKSWVHPRVFKNPTGANILESLFVWCRSCQQVKKSQLFSNSKINCLLFHAKKKYV